MAFDRIFIEIYPDRDCITCTEAMAGGCILPDRIIQKRYPIRPATGLYAVSRRELLTKLSSCLTRLPENFADNIEELYANTDIDNPVTWIEFAYLAVYMLNIVNKKQMHAIPMSDSIPLCMIEKEDSIEEKLQSYADGYDLDHYLTDIQQGIRYMPVTLYISYKLLQKKIKTLTEEYMFREICEKDLDKLERWLKKQCTKP